MHESPFPELTQLLGLNVGQDWQDSYDDIFEAAEAWMHEQNGSDLQALAGEIDRLFAAGMDVRSRRRPFHLEDGFTPDGPDFDEWLLAVQARARRAAVGDHSDPLVDPHYRTENLWELERMILQLVGPYWRSRPLDAWELARSWTVDASARRRQRVREEIAWLRADEPDAAARRGRLEGADFFTDPAEFDAWLHFVDEHLATAPPTYNPFKRG